jgi:hypothetical protein
LRRSQEDIELLDQYIKGTLDDQEIRDLETRLATETHLKSDLDDLKILSKGIRVNVLASKVDMMKSWEEEVALQKTSNNYWQKLALFLFFLILMGYLLYHFTLTSKGNIPEQYKTLYATEFDRSMILHSTKRAVNVTDSLSPEQRRAYEMYSIQLFDDAIPLLDALWTKQQDTLSLLYMGVSYVGVGDVDKGLEILKKPELNKYSEQTNLFINH